MTEKKTAEEILDKHIAIKLEAIPDIVPAMHEYAAQELDAYKARLKELLGKRINETDPFFTGAYYDIKQLIDKL